MKRIYLLIIQRWFLFAFFIWNLKAENVSDKDYAEGLRLFAEGEYEKAEKSLEKAYRNSPKNYRIAFDYAKISSSCSVSVAILTNLTNDKETPDSIKAEAFKMLGDYSFAHSAFKTAAEKYQKASSIVSSNPQYLHLWALSSLAAGDTAKAKSIWHTLTLEYGTEKSLMAHYYLGLLYIKYENYDSAFSHLVKCGSLNPEKGWTIAATAAKLECAAKLNKNDSVKIYEKQLQPFKDNLLERDRVDFVLMQNADKTNSKKEKVSSLSTSKEDTSIIYTLQVGAFSNLENAVSLQKKLEQKFQDVTVLPVTFSDRVFYRVRVGSFKSKEEAEQFGKKNFDGSGISCKAVVK
ncbi:MAG: SPOR domain-containing protein [Chitinispirillaceae bacterium]|nr:SPOR domain-containing protein [Chitinispirillaceae bacterium]